MRTFTVLFFLFVSLISFAQEGKLSKIDSIVNSKIKDTDPSLMVGIVKDGNIIFEKYRGLANLQHQVKANKNTKSNIASTAKQFTALMVLQLSLDAKLSLEDDIRKYLPTLYPKVKGAIKIRHLINHTSGIRDAYDLMSIQQNPWWRREGLDNDDVFKLLEKQEDLAFKPGSRYMYSNSGYILLSKIIEKVSGEKFHSYSKSFFENLGMKNTLFLKNYMHVIPNQAQPYSDWGNGVWQEYPMITNLYGDGFLFTTLKDQLIFEQAVQNAEHNYNVLLIKSQRAIPKSEITNYGFGLELEDRLNRASVHHSGGTGSYHSQVVRYPKEKLSIFVMSSNSRIWSGSIADEIARVLLPKKVQNNQYDSMINNNSGLTDINALVGQYRSPGEYLIRIEIRGAQLLWRNGNNNPRALSLEKDNIYRFTRNPKLKIGFYKDRLLLFYPSGKTTTYKKIPFNSPTLPDLIGMEGSYFSKELDVQFEIKQSNGKLMLSREKWKRDREIEVLNRNELLIYDFILKVQRDAFNRVTGILLTTNRVLNNKFVKKTKLKFQPTIPTKNGTIGVTTIGSRNGKSSQILLTKNYSNGNEIWSKQFGGKSYDKANSIIDTEDGYLIIGATSSYGNGNYDMFVVKTDKKGKLKWQKSYGKFYNEYGYTAEKTKNGYLLKGSIQKCTSNTDVFNRKCTTNIWLVSIDEKGNKIAETIGERIEVN